jgi:mRNA-degrading endonuclease toxin of MazEF toxin-antitoxin module
MSKHEELSKIMAETMLTTTVRNANTRRNLVPGDYTSHANGTKIHMFSKQPKLRNANTRRHGVQMTATRG